MTADRETKDATIPTRCTPAQKAMIVAAADCTGMGASTFLLTHGLAKAREILGTGSDAAADSTTTPKADTTKKSAEIARPKRARSRR